MKVLPSGAMLRVVDISSMGQRGAGQVSLSQNRRPRLLYPKAIQRHFDDTIFTPMGKSGQPNQGKQASRRLRSSFLQLILNSQQFFGGVNDFGDLLSHI